jgi:hypothetical protein
MGCVYADARRQRCKVQWLSKLLAHHDVDRRQPQRLAKLLDRSLGDVRTELIHEGFNRGFDGARTREELAIYPKDQPHRIAPRKLENVSASAAESDDHLFPFGQEVDRKEPARLQYMVLMERTGRMKDERVGLVAKVEALAALGVRPIEKQAKIGCFVLM